MNNLPKNLVSRRSASSPCRYQRVLNHATMTDKPIVSGTMKKWYTVVMPNCHRERSSADIR